MRCDPSTSEPRIRTKTASWSRVLIIGAAMALSAVMLSGCGTPSAVNIDLKNVASVDGVYVWPVGAGGSYEQTASIKPARIDQLVKALKSSRSVRSGGPNALLTTIFINLKNGDDIELQAGDTPDVRVIRGKKTLIVNGDALAEWIDEVRLD